MVQRKVPNKLGIQADHVKSDKLLANLKKPSSSQYQDGKNRGADMKKKMKKSRSIKLSDIESLRSSPTRRNISPPGKPPPAIPQKQQQPLIDASDGSPNYMKSTSCFEARKEQSQVSLRNTQTGSESKNMSRRSSSNSKHSSASGAKPARALTRTSSLKLASLTKTPSFKPARASAKKSSRVVLCADVNAQRSTCSSTLKDSKFPPYLMLSPGATESEGTSVTKVCPYTYCSLNGHRHSPLPPLKCFLSARRRLLKTQKSTKMEALSPRRAKLSSKGMEEIDTAKMIFDDESADKEDEFGNLATPPLVEDVGIDFFIEIYATKSKDNDTEAIGVDEEVAKHSDKEQVAESLSDGSAQSEVDFEEKLQQWGDIIATEMETTESLPGEQVKDADQEFLRITGIEADDAGSEATDMEWEEEHLSASEIDSEADYSIMTDDESVVSVRCSSDIKNPDFHNDYMIRSDDIDNSCSEVILAEEILQEHFAEEGANSEAQSDNDSASSEDAFDESETEEEENGQSETKLISTEIPSASMEEPIVEPRATSEGMQEKNRVAEINPQLGDDETNCTSKAADEVSNDDQKQKTLQDDGEEREEKEKADDAKILVEIQASDFSCYSEADLVSTEANKNESHKMTLSCQPDEKIEDFNSIEEIVDDSFTDKTQNHLSDDQNMEKDRGEAKNFKISSSTDDEGLSNPRMNKSNSAEESIEEVEKMEVEDYTSSDAADVSTVAKGVTGPETEITFFPAGSKSTQELPDSCNSQKWTNRRKGNIKDEEELREFNPREPNYLPLVPDPEAEKVDLRHQMEDERKNAEEWMLDYHLQKAVTKLAPARKRKVALLVEAFETVMPTSKFETHLRSSTAAFAHARPMQTCS
ncbi:calmodulin binding protein PICBP [Alnus glutinosa]|uniref:calmodulin binding protein PICBP n=1 Tax=Alnus glutinosa TaxID=3517 RepID=UPI002D79F30D|nr:calmodulin binding protein PICBP [Alnus glutinosa]